MTTATGEQLDDQQRKNGAPTTGKTTTTTTTPAPGKTATPGRETPLNGSVEPMDEPRAAR